MEAREMAQLLKVLLALPENPNLVPTTHAGKFTTACNSSFQDSNSFFCLHTCIIHLNIHTWEHTEHTKL